MDSKPDRKSFSSESTASTTTAMPKSSRVGIKGILCLIGFLDMLGVSLIMPLIHFKVLELGASPKFAGFMGSLFGILQLFSSPVVGHWSDKAGRRLCLYVCLIFTAVGYAILGVYPSLIVFFIGRVIVGFFKHSQTISKALLADLVTAQEQAKVMGQFNSFSSMGFIVGPIIGGHLAESQGGFPLVATMTGIVFLISTVVVLCFIPLDNKKTYHENSSALSESQSQTSLKNINADEAPSFSFYNLTKSIREFDWAELWDLFLIRFLAGFSMMIFFTNFSVALKQNFGASPKTRGYMMSYMGVTSALSGFLAGAISRWYKSPAKLYLHLVVLQSVTLLSLTFTSNLAVLVTLLTPLSLFKSVQRVASSSILIQRTGDKGLGEVMGVSQSVMSVARIAAPFLVGLVQEVSVNGPTYIGISAAAVSVSLMLLRPQDAKVKIS